MKEPTCADCKELIRESIAAERERCLRWCEEMRLTDIDPSWQECAMAIMEPIRSGQALTAPPAPPPAPAATKEPSTFAELGAKVFNERPAPPPRRTNQEIAAEIVSGIDERERAHSRELGNREAKKLQLLVTLILDAVSEMIDAKLAEKAGG